MNDRLINEKPSNISQNKDTAPKNAVFEIWNELYTADADMVKQAAEKLTSAKQFLEVRNGTQT